VGEIRIIDAMFVIRDGDTVSEPAGPTSLWVSTFVGYESGPELHERVCQSKSRIAETARHLASPCSHALALFGARVLCGIASCQSARIGRSVLIAGLLAADRLTTCCLGRR
jgi:hypothetical protein